MGKIPEYHDGNAFAYTDIKSYITATYNCRENMIELQMEENFTFEKFIRNKVPSKYRKRGPREKDKHFGIKIRTIYIHKKYWSRIWRNFEHHFQKAHLIKYNKSVSCLDIINKKVLYGDLYEEYERDDFKKKYEVYRDR